MNVWIASRRSEKVSTAPLTYAHHADAHAVIGCTTGHSSISLTTQKSVRAIELDALRGTVGRQLRRGLANPENVELGQPPGDDVFSGHRR